MENQATGDAPKGSIFFSYQRRDRERALKIISALQSEGFQVWWDQELAGGAAFSKKIQETINSADAVVVLWSENSISSEWVMDEAQEGRDRKRLIPLAVDGVLPPLGFRQLHCIDFESWNGKADNEPFRLLLNALQNCLGAPVVERSSLVSARASSTKAGPDRRTVLMFGVGGAVITGGAAVLLMRNADGVKAAANSIAVLPFRSLNQNTDQNYIADGISEEVRNVLARNAALRVVAQTSSAKVRDAFASAPEIARALSVSHILEGSVLNEGGSVKLNIELIEGKGGFAVWATSFVRPFEEIALLQKLIADAVARQLTLSESPSEGYGGTSDALAYNHFLQGRALYDAAESTQTDLAALSHFEQAIVIDRSFGAAHAALARTLTVLGNTSVSVDAAQSYYERASSAARDAVKLAPESADAYSTLGFVLFQAQLKVDEARAPFEASFRLGQGDATVMARYAAYAALTKNSEEAERAALRARELDPLNANIHRILGFVYYASRRFDESIAAVQRAISINPELSDAHGRIAISELQLGNLEKAKAAADLEQRRLFGLPYRAIILDRMDQKDEARKEYEALKQAYGDAGLYQQAQVLAQWGALGEAMETLKRAEAKGDSGLTYLYVDPLLDPLRDNSEFAALLRRLGFTA